MAKSTNPPAAEAPADDPLEGLTPEQAQMFVAALELAMKKRRLMLIGYLAAAFAVLIGGILALTLYANREPGQFVGWVFLVPFAAAGLFLYVFGRLARRLTPP